MTTTNRKKAERLYELMAELKTNCPNGTMLSSAVLCDHAGKVHFIKWIEMQLDAFDEADAIETLKSGDCGVQETIGECYDVPLPQSRTRRV